MPRRPSIDRETHDEIVSEFYDSIQEDLESRLDWVEKRVRSFEDWMNPNPGVKSYPWEGASNVTPPLIAKTVRALHARLLGSIFNADPLVHVMPVDSKNMEAARIREKFLNEQIRNEIPNFYRELNTALLEMIVQGTSFVMVWWDRERRLVPDWKLMERYVQLGPETVLERTDQEVLEELIPQILRTRAQGNHVYEVDHVHQGFERSSRVTLDRDDDQVPIDRISVTFEKEEITEGIRVRNLDLEDLVFPANATSLQLDDCHHVFRLFWLYPSQLRRKMEHGIYHHLTEEDIDKLERLTAGVYGSGLSTEVTRTKEVLDAYQGVELVNGTSGLQDGKVLVIEAYYPWDVNGDGLDEELVFTWIPELRKLATWDYLSVRFGHGRRPFIPFVFMPVTGRLYGIGLAEMLEDIQAEAATIFNQMNDRENLTNAPHMLVEMNAGISPNVFKNLPPGSAIPVRNVDRVKALEWGKDPHSGIPVLQQLYAFAEQIAGLGDIQVGVAPNRPNAPRTARGTLALISESNIVIDTHVLNAQYISFQELLSQIDGLNRQYMPPERVFFVVGEADPMMLTAEDLRDRVKFFFSGNTSNTNLQVRQTLAQFLFQSLIATPIYSGQFVQMPELSITAMHHLMDYFIKEHHPSKDSRFMLPPVEELIQFAQQVQQAQLQGMQQGRELGIQASQEMANQESMQAESEMAQLGGGNGGQPPA